MMSVANDLMKGIRKAREWIILPRAVRGASCSVSFTNLGVVIGIDDCTLFVRRLLEGSQIPSSRYESP